MSTAGLLGQVRARRRALDQAQLVYGERLAPDFGVFQFVDTSEEGISRVLAWLLDPRADHAQGDRFLKAFLLWLKLDWPNDAVREAQVQTEAPVASVNSTRFIDLLISGRNHALAVENKLWAPDQPKQVADYLNFLRKGYSSHSCLLYLTPDGRSPSNGSIPAGDADVARLSGFLHERSYEGLLEFLSECLLRSRSPRVSFFIEDLIQHIRQSVVGIQNMDETARLAAEIAEDSKSLSAALEIFEAEREVKTLLMKKSQAKIEERCRAEGWSVEGDITSGEKHDYLHIILDPKDVWGFGISFYHPNFKTI